MLSFKRLGIAIISVILLSLIFCQAFLISAGAGYSSGVTERLFEEFPLKNSSYSYKSSGISKPATESASVFYSHALLTEPVNEMSKDLAKASVALSMAAYDPSYVNSLLSKMGFDYDDNSAVYNRSRNELTIDDNDYVAYTIGYKEWTDPETDETYVFYCVPIQGTTGNAEWFSNFNMGTGIEHEGFRLASLEVYLKLKTKFNMDNASDNAHRIVWLTGHSRGAACANLIAGWLSADGEAYTSRDTVTAYTFACPAVSTNADTTLKNIFNFNNAGDLITMVPMKNWGFKRYGQDIDLDTSDAQFANMQMQFNSVTGDTYAGMKTGDDFNTLITNLLGNDRDLYNDTVPLQFSLDLIAWALGGENDVSINDIGRKHYSGFSNIGNKLESILEVGSGIVNLGDLLFFLSSDASEKDYIADYSYRVYLETQGLTEEEFLDYISAYDIRNLISDIKKETTIVVDEASDFWAAYVVLNDRNHDTVAIIDCVQAAMNIVSDENGNPLDKIKHAHCQALYTTWINSMYYGYRGWAGNTSITDVTIDRGIYTVGEQCFTGCTSITNANMNRTVKFMGPQAFYNCSAIKELTIPVEYDPTGIFGSISGVEKITYYAGSTGVMQDRINNYNKTVEYLNRNRLTTVIFEEGITHIGSYAFYGYYNGNGNVLTNVTLPSTLQSIGDYAFSYCTSLAEITLPESLDRIGSYAFSNSGISKIVFCGDAPVFSSNAFNGLTATVYYPKNNDTWSEYTMLQYGGDITWVEGDEYTHVHSLEYFDAKAPTCTEGGWDAYEACRVCDYSTYVEIPATGHSPEYFDSKAPTCTEGGWDAYEACSVCGYSTYVELPAFGHFYVDGSCESCGEVDPDATLPEPELPDAGDVILGDVNGDGVVNGKDSNVIRKILGGSYSASELETLAADVNRDGLINGVDANYIARYIAGNITDFN